MWLIHLGEENLLKIFLPQVLHELIHPVLAARLPEDTLMACKGLHVGEDLKQDNLTTAGDGGTKYKSLASGRSSRG